MKGNYLKCLLRENGRKVKGNFIGGQTPYRKGEGVYGIQYYFCVMKKIMTKIWKARPKQKAAG